MIGDRWGVTAAETRIHYPCDELVPDAGVQLWRGVSVRATPQRVWPWIVQIRLAPYSYDWIDNFGRRSPAQLRGLSDPQVGDPYSTAFGRRDVGRILAIAPGQHLTGEIMGAVMSYLLVAEVDCTRLLLKIVLRERRTIISPALSLGDLIMARRQLLNLAALAERQPAV